MLRRLVSTLFRRSRYASGGRVLPYRPNTDDVPVILSPGWYEVPPGTKRRLPPGALEGINTPRRR